MVGITAVVQAVGHQRLGQYREMRGQAHSIRMHSLRPIPTDISCSVTMKLPILLGGARA